MVGRVITHRAFLGLGSNLGDREALLAGAVRGLPGLVAVSSLYETAPIGGPEQPSFLNLVAEVVTELGPFQLLEAGRALEREADRVRIERWGPRTLDIDVLLYGELRLNDPVLSIPHPRMFERRFVLEPLAEVGPELVTDPQLLAVADQEIERLGPLELG